MKNERNNRLGAPMRNESGEYNCFVNVVIHAIYQIKQLRNYFLKSKLEDQTFALMSELQNLIIKYHKIIQSSTIVEDENANESDRTTLDPFFFRKELAALYRDEKKFQLNAMADPVELFWVIQSLVHSIQVNSPSLSSEERCEPACIAHSLFWINLVEQFNCISCGSTSEILKYDYNYFIYEVYVNQVLSAIEKDENENKKPSHLFHYLKEINTLTSAPCPGKCNHAGKVKRLTYILNCNPFLCFNLVWTSSRPDLSDISEIFYSIPIILGIEDLFCIDESSKSEVYELFGMIGYYGLHYICFFKSKEDVNWTFYNDTFISQVLNWEEVINKCIQSHFYPTMIFYRLCKNKTKIKKQNEKHNITENNSVVKTNQLISRSKHEWLLGMYNESQENRKNDILEEHCKINIQFFQKSYTQNADNQMKMLYSAQSLHNTYIKKEDDSTTEIVTPSDTRDSKLKQLWKCTYCNYVNNIKLLCCKNCRKKPCIS